MSNLSGYDSEAIGFDSVASTKRSETTSSTQTGDFSESGVGTQTALSQDCGASATPEDLGAQDDILREYPPPGLNEFLRRVVPGMLQQLDEEQAAQSSDEESEPLQAILRAQRPVADSAGVGAGDQASTVLALSWSSSGSALAVSVGAARHEAWCAHGGVLRVYTVRQDGLQHALDVNERECVTAVRYHPSVAALLAYGTTSGEVVICDLRGTTSSALTLATPAGCHGGQRVSGLRWAGAHLANTYLTMQILSKGKRRGASDQILLSSGCDGTLNVWQVNLNMKIFENVVTYNVNGSRKMAAPDITCFDFIKSCPLRPSEEKVDNDLFVVGTKSGELLLCRIKSPQVMEGDVLDPVFDVLDGHLTCVLDVAFSGQKPGIFVSVSIDSELRVYDIHQACPLKVCHIDAPVSCVAWLPNYPCVCVLGTSGPPGGSTGGSSGGPTGGSPGGSNGVILYNASSGKRVPVAGLDARNVTAVDVNQSGSCRIACGDAEGCVRVWELPARRMRLTADDLDF